MAAWTGWFGRLGDALVDGGNPISHRQGNLARRLGHGRDVRAERLLDHQGRQSRRRRGRSPKGCPVLAGGAAVVVSETFPVM